jgi:predicted metal-dependent phosphoesterase TrpH
MGAPNEARSGRPPCLSEEPTVVASGFRPFRADLHVHTALSPCGSEEMTPPAIVSTALARRLDMIAICDHNAAGNVGAVQDAARAAGGPLSVLAGMEITTAEEVHVVGLFPDLGAAEAVAASIRTMLSAADADYCAFFGEQWLLAADGRQTGTETAALALATPLSLNAAVELIHSSGGLAVAAHLDRRLFSALSQLGVFPRDAGFDGVEVSSHTRSDSPRLPEFRALDLPIVGSSDSHFLEEIGTMATDLWIKAPTFAELAMAFAGVGGRSVARA